MTPSAARAAAPVAVVVAALLTPSGAAASAAAGSAVGGERLASSGVVVDAPGATPLPEVGAAAWVLADLETGEVVAARDPHGSYRPASTLKILTALTVLPQLDKSSTYVAQWEDANAEGSKVGVVPDATYTVHNLLEALILVSGNDAAHALANAAGGVEQTVARMNEVARGLGALDTTAVNPSGLDAPGQFTSAYDLAVISRAAMAREDFRAYASTVKSQFPGKMPRAGEARKTYEIYTQDRLLLNYRGAIGIKTGWTTKARGTFVGAATRGGRTLVATVLKTEGDGWRDAAALLTWGFRNGALANPVGTLDAVATPKAQDRKPAQGVAGRPRDAVMAGGSGEGLPWWLEAPIVLFAVVALLRARVLLKQRLRKQRLRRRRLASSATGGLPRPRPRPAYGSSAHPRERRRSTSAATPAPMPAPSNVRRHLPGEDGGDSTSSASTGTAS